jgi:nitroreductase
MQLESVIKSRRSIRKFKNKGIALPVVKSILGLARYSPSSMDGQPWHFIVVTDLKTKKRLAEIKNKYCPIKKRMYRADFITKAPVIIVITVDRKLSYDRQVENGVLACAHIMLAAQNKKLGTTYMSAYKEGEPRLAQEIRELLAIPRKADPINIIPLGYPDEKCAPKKIRRLEKIISYENFGKR